jgi:RNA polymerase subunit RPABC4/transcription elongation factor Spt4
MSCKQLAPSDAARCPHCGAPSLVVALTDPSNKFAIVDLKARTGYNIEVLVASATAMQVALHDYYST